MIFPSGWAAPLAASIVLDRVSFADPAIGLMASYAAYLCSVLLGMASLYALIAGAVRFGAYGRASNAESSTANDTGDVLTQLQIISDRMLLSDTAKRIVYRDRDRVDHAELRRRKTPAQQFPWPERPF